MKCNGTRVVVPPQAILDLSALWLAGAEERRRTASPGERAAILHDMGRRTFHRPKVFRNVFVRHRLIGEHLSNADDCCGVDECLASSRLGEPSSHHRSRCSSSAARTNRSSSAR